MSDRTLLRVSGLEVAYRDRSRLRPVLHGVDLEVAPGEIVAVVGESGSGKSTLVNAALGLLPASGRVTAGSAEIGGVVTASSSGGRPRAVRGSFVGYVPQDPLASLNPTMRIGAQIVEAVPRARTRPPEERRALVLDALRRAGLPDAEELLSRHPHELSGGMRQRVLIATALVSRPRLVVADEPTSALDATVQALVIDDLAEQARSERLGLLLVTHNLLLATDRADRIVVMRQGRVVEEGAADEILRHPAHDYTRTLLRRVPGVIAVRDSRPLVAEAERDAAADVLRLDGVTRRFRVRGDSAAAVDGVSLRVRSGRSVGLVGESGSGKTTTLRIALRLERPDEGRVHLFGTDITRVPEHRLRPLRRRVQLVQQDPWGSLDPRMSLRESIREPLDAFAVGRRSEREARVREVLDAVALPQSLLGRRPRELSGGQRQRVALARALAVRPDVLLLDEPVSALDVSVQYQILELLRELQAELGVGYLLVSHDLAVVRQICDEIVVLHRGAVVDSGATDAVLASPRSPETRRLVESVPGVRSLQILRGASWFSRPDGAPVSRPERKATP